VVLRHQLKVLRRQVARPALGRRDRTFLAAASRVLPRECWASFLVTPQTLLRWHRDLGPAEGDQPADKDGTPAD
jgi:putative transposase